MLIYFTTRIISSFVAFLYPGYASYKTLSQRPASEADLERWLMYWSVLGCIVGVEYVAEWLVSWIPLYYTMKTIFLLYLSLPQTMGSSYLYIHHLQPFFHYYESDIDATLVKLKTRIYTFVQERLRMLWDQVMASLGHAADPNATGAAGPGRPALGADTAQPPTMADPVAGPAQLIGGLWRTYGPAIVASGAALMRQSAQTSAAGGVALFNGLSSATPAAQAPQSRSQPRGIQGISLLERRRQLEAELASLPPIDEIQRPRTSSSQSSGSEQSIPETTIPVQHGSSSYLPVSPSGSDADLRARMTQYEEVEVPSDVEGYDVSGTPRHTPAADAARPLAADRRTSWFGWGSTPSTPAAGDKGAKKE